jgi:hypothetical protein
MSLQHSIIEHYISNWQTEPNVYLYDKGPIQKLPFDFRVLEFPPTSARDYWIYSTCCMSQPSDVKPIELHILSSHQSKDLIELLTSLAYYHRTTSILGLNHTVNFGRPWQDNSNCSHGFISLPYLDGPKLENLYIIELSKTVKFYWIIPITEMELEFKKKYGVEALEKLFEESQINFLDEIRESLI